MNAPGLIVRHASRDLAPRPSIDTAVATALSLGFAVPTLGTSRRHDRRLRANFTSSRAGCAVRDGGGEGP